MNAGPLWAPSPQRAASTNLARFASSVGIEGYEALHQWSVSEPEAFWPAVWRFCGLVGEPGRAVDRDGTFAGTRFFPDQSLNVAEVILDGLGAAPDAPMYVAVDERGSRSEMTRAEARALVGAVAAALRADGVGAGDRVAIWLPNIIEAQIVMLAAASIGAVFASTSPDFGVDGVVDRFSQIAPTVLVAADGYCYGGKQVDCLDRLTGIRAGIGSVRRTVVIGCLDPVPSLTDGVTGWNEWIAPYSSTPPHFEPQPFDHPWYVLFSSGTTGVPKCIIHRTGGVLVQHLKEHQLHCDIRPGDRVMYFTTAGWMMWNWLATVPASGATAVLYDGSPFHPSPAALFDVVQAEALTFLGVGAKFIDSCRKEALSPRRSHDVSSLRTIASTGSPLSIESFEWVYSEVATDVHLASISGGTDLCGCLVGGDPTSAVWAGEIQRPALGMAVTVWDLDGQPTAVDERGELVCVEPFPSMPLGFWGDPGGARYHAAYYERFEGVWAQGDFASWTEHGGMVIHGRSDTTLNPGGVRIGTAEIYRQVERSPEVLESLVFGQEWEGDTRIVLLVRLADGVRLTEELASSIRRQIRDGCTPRHVPARIAVVDDLPRTRSGKLAELAVSDIVNGRVVRNTSALANPETLEVIAALPALRN